MDQKLWSHKTGGLWTQVDNSENCTFGTLKGQSLNTGGLKDRFDCTYSGFRSKQGLNVTSCAQLFI